MNRQSAKPQFPSLILFLLALLASPMHAGAATLRLAMVNVPDEVVRPLLPEFNKTTGIDVTIVYTGNDPFSVARSGGADLVISHYGHEGVEPFVTGGWGLWPHPVFANQMVLLGPPGDPAQVRDIPDAAVAFSRIAKSNSPFLSNNSGGAKYLEELLWDSAKISSKGTWYMDLQSQGPQAARQAADKGAYVLWGLAPFLRFRRQGPVNLEPLVVQDPILQRIMVAIVVNPEKVTGVDAAAAVAFQKFLIAPATQARIRAFRYPDYGGQAWWPAGRHNSARE